MELFLKRSYYPQGCNGRIEKADGALICHSIELPWRENARRISCIPEGRYALAHRYSRRWGWHILIKEVPERSLILFHPANVAVKELEGCIAPVSSLSGAGVGSRSRAATAQLEALVFPRLAKGKAVWLNIVRAKLAPQPLPKLAIHARP